MALVGGPRQVGKTTFALGFLGEGADETHPAYLNWDHPQVRRAFRQGELPAGERLILLDEIHKYRHCRNTLEGLYDTEKSRRRFIVTGSARLDYCRKGGDSLAGRYRYYRLHPFSVREMVSTPSRSDLDALLKCRGSRAAFRAERSRTAHLAAGPHGARRVRGSARPGAGARDQPRRAACRPAAIAGRGCALREKPARGPGGGPQDRGTLAQDLGEPLRRLPHPSLWRAARSRPRERAQALPLGLVRHRGRGTAIREPRRLAAPEVLPLDRGHAGSRDGAALPLRDTDRREADFVVPKDRRPLFAAVCKTGKNRSVPRCGISPNARRSRASTRCTSASGNTRSGRPPSCPSSGSARTWRFPSPDISRGERTDGSRRA